MKKLIILGAILVLGFSSSLHSMIKTSFPYILEKGALRGIEDTR